MTSSSLLPDVGIELREGYAAVGDQSLHYVEAGDGPLIVLLHGFPELCSLLVVVDIDDSLGIAIAT